MKKLFILLGMVLCTACTVNTGANKTISNLEHDQSSQNLPAASPSKWEVAELEGGLVKHFLLSSHNHFDTQDGFGVRKAVLILIGSKNRQPNLPMITWISKEQAVQCNDETDETCVAFIAFDSAASRNYPIQIEGKDMIHAAYILDEGIFAELEKSKKMTVRIPTSKGYGEEIIFETQGFKKDFLHF